MSGTSRATGDANRSDDDRDDAGDDDDHVIALRIELETMRYRHLGWTGAGLVLGSLMVWKLGAVGQWLGVVLLVIGAVAGWAFIRTVRFPPGTIVIGPGGVELPRGLCKGAPATFALADVRHAYLLRRSVPWTRAAPVLVVEAGGQAFTYPRDWFLTESDQRRVVRALDARPRADAEAEADDAAEAAGEPA